LERLDWIVGNRTDQQPQPYVPPTRRR
jgi:hypothetical protein